MAIASYIFFGIAHFASETRSIDLSPKTFTSYWPLLVAGSGIVKSYCSYEVRVNVMQVLTVLC